MNKKINKAAVAGGKNAKTGCSRGILKNSSKKNGKKKKSPSKKKSVLDRLDPNIIQGIEDAAERINAAHGGGNSVNNLEWVNPVLVRKGGRGPAVQNQAKKSREKDDANGWYGVGKTYNVQLVGDWWRMKEAVYAGRGRWKIDGKIVKVEKVIGEVPGGHLLVGKKGLRNSYDVNDDDKNNQWPTANQARKLVADKLIAAMQEYKESLRQDPGSVWKAIALGVDQCIDIVKEELGMEDIFKKGSLPPEMSPINTGQVGRGVGNAPVNSKAQRAIQGLKNITNTNPFSNEFLQEWNSHVEKE